MRKAVDKTKLAKNSALSNSVAKFAEKLKDKFIKMTSLASQAKKQGVHVVSGDAKANAAKLAEANKRITALEAALSQLGGLKGVEAVEGTKLKKGAEATIETDKAKLAKTEKRINILNDKIIKAKVSKDTKAQIELGTEKKEARLSAAVRKANAAKAEREKLLEQETAIRQKLAASMHTEHQKIATANKAKASLAVTMSKLKKQEEGEKGKAKEMKAKLAAKEKTLKAQEKKAQANSNNVKSEIASTELVLNKSESTLKVAKQEAAVAVSKASKTLVFGKGNQKAYQSSALSW